MTCVEKRHMSHRTGSMLHHRFPNGFTDLFMDETDREVSTLTDRAFRSLCVGDDAVYNDELLYGYSPFSCHKPLAGEPLKKTSHKESKKQGQNKTDKNHAQPWKQQQPKNISNMSSFLKALNATEGSCESMLIKNGGMTDANGESWDKSALRSIQRELLEFSDYQTNITDGQNHQHHSDGSSNKTGKDNATFSGKSSKSKHGKSTVKLKKLNIKNFFLHSELSPFQTWRDFNQFPFGQEDTSILPTTNIPKWYDLPFYKELTEAHRKETLHTEVVQSCQKAAVEPPPPTAPKPIPPPPPPKVLPKPLATPAGMRCSSEGGDGSAAPWRRNRSRATSVIPVNQPVMPPQGNSSKTVDESLWMLKKEPRSVEVKAVEEVSSLASTPFSICQLMTPLIPSRQTTETSEIFQDVLSPSFLDLPLRPHSEAKLTPEPPVKRENYKSLASSILFNLKDNRKRVKSRYSPPKFKTLEMPEGGTQSPQSDYLKYPAGSEGYASGLSTPAILRDGQALFSPILESEGTSNADYNENITDRPVSVDYLLSNLLQTKKEAAGSHGEASPISPFINSKKTKSPKAKKTNYPSLNLYKKASPVDSNMKYLLVPLSPGASAHIDQPSEANELSPLTLNRDLSPKAMPTNTGLSPSALNVNKDHSTIISTQALEKEELSSNVSVGKRATKIPDKAKQLVKDVNEKDPGPTPVSSKEKDTNAQHLSTLEVIRAAREAINAAKNKALIAAKPDNNTNVTLEIEEPSEKEVDMKVTYSKEMFSRKSSVPENCDVLSENRNEATQVVKNTKVKKDPPPVPKRNFDKPNLPFFLDNQKKQHVDSLTNGDLGNTKLNSLSNENIQKRGKPKHAFSARQNSYIKNQRYTETNDEPREEFEESNLKVNIETEAGGETTPLRETRDSEHIINDLHALKGLERARLGDRVLDNAKNKLGDINIEEEARAKNDLISRELRNIKKGMMSMRGNTTTKRDIFAQKEKDQSKQENFTKIDGNVIVNKALINDNYDRAKMALEEIISDRQKRKNSFTEPGEDLMFNEKADEGYVTRVEQRKKAMKDSMTEAKDRQNGSALALKEKDLKERLGDLRDHNHMRQILSQTEPKHGETHRLGSRLAPPNTIDNNSSMAEELSFRHIERQISEESGENLLNQNEGNKGDAPPVPPRSKKGGSRRDGSVTAETDSLKDEVEEDIFNIELKYENGEPCLKEARSEVVLQDVDSVLPIRESGPTSPVKERWDVANYPNSKSNAVWSESTLLSKYPQSEMALCLSPELRRNKTKANNLQADLSPTREATFNNSNARAPESYKVKRRAPLRPDHLVTPIENKTINLMTDEPEKMDTASEKINVEAEALGENPREIISPLLLVNGISITQSPPDQASLSSKSSYFSVESALHRNTETESNVFHSLENLLVEMEEVNERNQNTSGNTKRSSDRTEYYSLSDHESEPEFAKRPTKSPLKETEELCLDSIEDTTVDETIVHDEDNPTPMSPSNIVSPTLGIPALFKVKDNTFTNRSRVKAVQPWSTIGSLNGTERGEEVHQLKDTQELPPANKSATRGSTPVADEIFKPKENPSNSPTPLLLSPSNLQTENTNTPQLGGFLTVPQEEDRLSGVSPLSEGVESVATSTADTADEMGLNQGVSKVPSERSGSTCSGTGSQTGMPKPPVVLPKSEKAVLKAIKLTNKRIKKEEAQKSTHKSSQSGSRHRAERHKSEKSEHKSSSSQSSKSSERHHREKSEEVHHNSEGHHVKNSTDQNELLHVRRVHTSVNHRHNQTEMHPKARKHSHSSVESNTQSNETTPSVTTERQGRSSTRQIKDKPEQRHYSSDRVISNVPVYKAQLSSERPTSDRPFNRSQSIDRYLGDKVERRLSSDSSGNEKLDQRTQRIEKSIMDELQRGRIREKANRENPLRRSHSIDAYTNPNPNPHPVTLSRQSSHTSHSSQLSRQSSLEHAIVTQSFPMTQRKLLQDPDSGQYFFVDMPVQVKTKTFFDPETGSYVQLPVQPPEGTVPQASPLEVLTQPLVVYHSFVPVPLSPMAQKTTIQAPHMEPRMRQMHFTEAHPYLEPVYGQHEHMLGEFLGTEELDCPS